MSCPTRILEKSKLIFGGIIASWIDDFESEYLQISTMVYSMGVKFR